MRRIVAAAALVALTGCAGQTAPSAHFTLLVGERAIDVEAADTTGRKNAMLVSQFLTAFGHADPVALAQLVSEDFIWHLHISEGNYRGRTVVGRDGIIAELEDRHKTWSNVHVSDIRIFAAGDRVIQTYRISGQSARSGAFDALGVDLYIIRGGRITIKDSYWKQ